MLPFAYRCRTCNHHMTMLRPEVAKQMAVPDPLNVKVPELPTAAEYSTYFILKQTNERIIDLENEVKRLTKKVSQLEARYICRLSLC